MTGSAMAGGLEISGDLQQWAGEAGFSLTPSDPYGRAIFSSKTGETRYFIGGASDGWLRVTSSNRMGSQQLELAAQSVLPIEKFFYGSFGWDIRYYHDFPRATVIDRLPAGFQVNSLSEVAGRGYLAQFNAANRDYLAQFNEQDPDYLKQFGEPERDYQVLIDPEGGWMVDASGEVLAKIRLANLAVYLNYDTEHIKASFMTPDGADLLAVSESEGNGEPG